ncbi:MAG: rhomboid family intramembrane serine protease [Desulfobacteraceae bacterium]|nr:rhomboid family intramembrane serine protease [Desulfobacteraceae bacterium]
MNRPVRNSIICPNCRKLISIDEPRCPFCGIQAPGSRWKNNPLTRGWGSGEQLIKIILYVNIGMYVLSLLLVPRRIGFGFNPFGLLSPNSESLAILGATGTWLMHRTSGWWTLLAANYLHGSAMHILFNMLAFYQLAPLVTQLYGPYRFFIIYTGSGVLGFLLSYFAGIPITIGASAALCGLIGAAIYYGKHRGGLFGNAIYRQVGGWALGVLVFGIMVPQVNNWAHVGGMISGALIGMLLGYIEKSRETATHKMMAGVCAAATALALAWGVLRGILVWVR